MDEATATACAETKRQNVIPTVLWIKCNTTPAVQTKTKALSQALMKSHAARLETVIPVTSFHMGWHNMLLPFRFYQVQDGQGWGSGDKDMESERAGCGKQDIA